MKNSRILGMFLMGASLMLGANKGNVPEPGSDQAIAAAIQHQVLMYPYYTVWDEVGLQVAGGQVALTGAVSQPYKKDDIERLVRKVPGVSAVNDQIKVLPLSDMDDRLRYAVANAIYRYPALSRYAMGSHPPIHILVDNGHVTLTGVVGTEMDKELAGMRASSAGLSFGPVVNNLQVENPPAKKS
jgi:hyperosmotically inducible protein